MTVCVDARQLTSALNGSQNKHIQSDFVLVKQKVHPHILLHHRLILPISLAIAHGDIGSPNWQVSIKMDTGTLKLWHPNGQFSATSFKTQLSGTSALLPWPGPPANGSKRVAPFCWGGTHRKIFFDVFKCNFVFFSVLSSNESQQTI